MIWPFSLLPWWLNYLAAWTGYGCWVAFLFIIIFFSGNPRDDELEHWQRLTAKADKEVERQ